MRILKTLLASSAFIPLSVIGQIFGWFFAILCLFIWNITLRGQADGNLLSHLFSEFFPWAIAGCFGGGFAAFGVRAAYKKYHPTVILFIPALTAITAILGSVFFLVNTGYSHRELGWIITISCNAMVFYVALRDEYPPILNEL